MKLYFYNLVEGDCIMITITATWQTLTSQLEVLDQEIKAKEQELLMLAEAWKEWFTWTEKARKEALRLESEIAFRTRFASILEGFISTYNKGPKNLKKQRLHPLQFLEKYIKKTRKDLLDLIQTTKKLGIMEDIWSLEVTFREHIEFEKHETIPSNFYRFLVEAKQRIASNQYTLALYKRELQEKQAIHDNDLRTIRKDISTIKANRELVLLQIQHLKKLETELTQPPLPIINPKGFTATSNKRLCEKKCNGYDAEESLTQSDASPYLSKPWEFFIAFQGKDRGKPLPSEKKLFLRYIQIALDKVGMHEPNLSEIIHQAITRITTLSMQERLRMDSVQDGEFRDWKIFRPRRWLRIFFITNEQENKITFSPHQRKNAYK